MRGGRSLIFLASLLASAVLLLTLAVILSGPAEIDKRGPRLIPKYAESNSVDSDNINQLINYTFAKASKQYHYDPKAKKILVKTPKRARRPLLIPVRGVKRSALFDSYNYRRSGGRIHRAIDIMAPEGSHVIAAADGVIAKLHDSNLGGTTIYQFSTDRSLSFYYAHLDDYASHIREGMRVRRGDLIGYVGSTGNADDDYPHLHFAVYRLGPYKRWWRGAPINPYPLLGEK